MWQVFKNRIDTQRITHNHIIRIINELMTLCNDKYDYIGTQTKIHFLTPV